MPAEHAIPQAPKPDALATDAGVRSLAVDAASAGLRLDVFLTAALPDVSRTRVKALIERGQVQVDGAAAASRLKLRAGQIIEVVGELHSEPLRAIAEEIPLDILFEDDDLAVVNKPAGMMVHAGAGATDDERNRGTLVNALLHYLQSLSAVGGHLRPGIVHRLDKQTSGLIVVAKNDRTHRLLSEMFSQRHMEKTYVALVAWPAQAALRHD